MKTITLTLLFFVASLNLIAQVGIGTTAPDPSAALEVKSTAAGILVPKMTQVQRDAIPSPAIGLMIFQTNNTPGFYYYTGTAWTPFTGDDDWTIAGPNIYNANPGKVGVGTTTPSAPFHVKGTTTINPGNTSTLINQNFQNYNIVQTSTSTGCNGVDWQNLTPVQALYGGYCAGCAGKRAEINSDIIGCNQNATMIMAFTPTATSINITFDYGYRYFSGDNFKVTLYNETTATTVATLLNLSATSTATYTGAQTVIANNNYSLRFQYIANYDYGVDVDNVIVTQTASPTVTAATFRLEDGTQAAGKVLISDTNGNAYWGNASGGSGGGGGGNPASDGDWTVSGTQMTNDNSGNVGIGVTTPLSKLHVENNVNSNSVIRGINLSTAQTKSYGIYGVSQAANQKGAAGVFGESTTSGDHEMGVKGDYSLWGAAVAGIGWATTDNDLPTLLDMGVYGAANFDTGVGVYGKNKNNSATSYGVYYINNMAGTGTKSASIPTTQGNQLVYSMESPEIWFEDFGEGTLTNGRAHIILDEMFQESVFIDQGHPMHVFLQEQGDCKGLYFKPDSNGKGFTVTEKQGGNSNITFSYRITAKRRFYQDHRFGVDALQPLENNLVKAEYVKPGTTDLNKMKAQVMQWQSEKNGLAEQQRIEIEKAEVAQKEANAAHSSEPGPTTKTIEKATEDQTKIQKKNK